MGNFSICIYRGHLIVVFVDLKSSKYGFHTISPDMEWCESENADRCKSIDAALKIAMCQIDLAIAIAETEKEVCHAK